MINRFTTLAAAAALSLGFSAPAAAGEMTPIGKVGLWELDADATLCRASLEYEDDAFLIFGINTKGGATVVIANPKWDIPEGTYQVVSWVDRGSPVTFTAKASGRAVIWGYPLNAEQIGILSRGAVLHARIGRAEVHYRLDGSAAMLAALTRCAASRMVEGNPFAGAPSAPAPTDPFAETASNPYRRM
jgi:hypothetical protein